MDSIINMIENNYLLDGQKIERLGNGNILFTEYEGEKEEQTKEKFINDYIDFLTDLLNDNREMKEYIYCINILKDLSILYEGLNVIQSIEVLKEYNK